MANFGAKILNNATGALSAQQAAIATTGNNIANVNTPGYARRIIDLQTRAGGASSGTLNPGSGVEIGQIQRVADNFVERVLQEAHSGVGDSDVRAEFVTRLEKLFSVSGESSTISTALNGFFNSLNDLTTNPSSIELRANVIQKTQDLITVIRNTFNGIAQLQAEADTRLTTEIKNVNSITEQIANLNGLISQREATGQSASDERDRRDVLLNDLAEKIGYSTINQADGTVTLSLSNGFALVNGTSFRTLEVTDSPSFLTGNAPPSLDGGILGYVVYDYDTTAGNAHFDMTNVLKSGGGTVGGLIAVRGTNSDSTVIQSPFEADGILVEMASRVESITRQLLTTVNQTYRGPDEDSGTVGHQSTAIDLNGNPVTNVYGLFDWTAQTASAKDVNGDGLANDLDQPVLGVQNYSSLLTIGFTDPRLFAAARDSNATAGAISFESGNGENARALADLENVDHTFALGSYGSFSLTGTFSGVYDESVTHVGNAKQAADLNLSVAQANLQTAIAHHDEISSVSLDEEFTNLIRFQKAYQASARMIKVADDLMTQIIQLI